MRVLYSFPHALGRPGIGTTAFHQVQGLIDQGLDVVLYCTSLQRKIVGARAIVETLVVAGKRVPHRALGVSRAYAYHDWRVARALRRLAEEIDVVHCWPAGCLRTLAAARAVGILSLREVPSAHTESAYERAAREAHDLGLELPKNHHHRFRGDRLARELEEFRCADLLLVPSQYVASTFLDRGFASDELARHQYGFEPKRFWPDVRASHQGATGRVFTAVFVGRCEPNKGLHYALRAWVDAGIENGRFLICGTFLPQYRETLGGLLAHRGIEILGFVPDIAEVMRNADVLVLPSVTEGSALVTYEAQACGCVLVVSDAAGAATQHMERGLVHRAGDLATLTEHIRLLYRDRELLARLRASTLANAKELTWDCAAMRLAEIYATGVRDHG